MSIPRNILIAFTLWIPAAIAADAPAAGGPLPGDDALTCEQIYAQGMAITQREQQARNERTGQLRAQSQATGALVGATMATGGLLGTGPAAQASAEALAARQISMLTPEQVNPRKEYLRQLWMQKCSRSASAASPSGASPQAVPGPASNESAMTCEQIAIELSSYGQQLTPNLGAMAASTQQLYAQADALGQQRRVENMLMVPAATAGALDPTGISKRAYQAAVIAKAAKERAENEALANSPLAQQQKAQMQQFAAQGQQMQGDARLQQLLQLGHEKGCDRK